MVGRAGFHVFRLDFPGRWADAWLYKGHLLLWDRQNNATAYKLESVLSHLGRFNGPEVRSVAEYCLFRTDWKHGAPLKSLLALPGVDRALHSAFSWGDSPPSVDLFGLRRWPIGGECPDGMLLDTTVYANRIFIGTTSGLYETMIRLKSLSRPYGTECVFEERVESVSAKYYAVNASAGEQGLWFRRIILGQEEMQPHAGTEMQKIAELSYQNSTSARNLVNYTGTTVPEIFRARDALEIPHPNADRLDWTVRGYHPVLALSPRIQEALRHRGDLHAEEAYVLGNSDYRFLISSGSKLSVLDLGKRNDTGELGFSGDRKFPASLSVGVEAESVLETHAFGTGFLLETDDKVVLVDEAGSMDLIDGVAARIRTFRSSMQYLETAAIILEDRLSLVGLYRCSYCDQNAGDI